VSKNRLEAFSDGVLAVAITLLVLNITVPGTRRHSLAYGLAHNWPHYAAYATSFITIGIIWIYHHAMIGRLREVDHTILFWNLLLLMSVGILPFATSLMAAFLERGQGEHLAAAIYGGSLLLMSLVFSALNRHILLVRPGLMRSQASEHERREIFKRALAGIVPYVIATALAPVSAYATLAICAVVAAYYALPRASSTDLAAGSAAR
jgi:TMEM175 potassium channel family protein